MQKCRHNVDGIFFNLINPSKIHGNNLINNVCLFTLMLITKNWRDDERYSRI